MKLQQQPQGSLLIEVMVSIAIALMFTLTIGTLVTANSSTLNASRKQAQATAIAKNSMEQLFAAKHQSWETIALLSPGYVSIEQQEDAYAVVQDTGTPPGEQIDGIFQRNIEIQKAYRDETGNLADEGTEDQKTRKIIVTVSWDDSSQARVITLTAYVTNWK